MKGKLNFEDSTDVAFKIFSCEVFVIGHVLIFFLLYKIFTGCVG